MSADRAAADPYDESVYQDLRLPRDLLGLQIGLFAPAVRLALHQSRLGRTGELILNPFQVGVECLSQEIQSSYLDGINTKTPGENVFVDVN